MSPNSDRRHIVKKQEFTDEDDPFDFSQKGRPNTGNSSSNEENKPIDVLNDFINQDLLPRKSLNQR